MNGLKEQIEEARDRVAYCRLRAERPSARLKDEYALEKARTRLLTLELKCLKSELKSPVVARSRENRAAQGAGRKASGNAEIGKLMRTKHKHLSLSAREKAELSFAALQKENSNTTEGR